jgi:hypothetical protein
VEAVDRPLREMGQHPLALLERAMALMPAQKMMNNDW